MGAIHSSSRLALFVPPAFVPDEHGIVRLEEMFGQGLRYATRGRWALYHILRSLNVRGKVLIPAYLCGTVIEPLRKLGLSFGFFDIDPSDLNPCVDSLEFEIRRQEPSAILFPSLYGLPANISRAEAICREHDVRLIDDAAQAAGASLEGRWLGTFGDAGFISFSPGKPLAGAMGAYWLCREGQRQEARRRPASVWQRKLVWAAWEAHRYRAYQPDWRRLGGALRIVERMVCKWNDMADEGLCDFERPLLGGLVSALLDGRFAYRLQRWDELAAVVPEGGAWRVLRSLRGHPHPHKLVLVAERRQLARQLIMDLRQKGIATLNGYASLCRDERTVPNTLSIEERVVELPLESNPERMAYLADTLRPLLRESH